MAKAPVTPAKKAPAQPGATVTVAPAGQPVARANAHGIGKAWQGPTSITRMALPVAMAYAAYLQSVAKPNARQQRHAARAAKHVPAMAAAANTTQAAQAAAAQQALAQYSPGNNAAQQVLAQLAQPASTGA